MLLKEQKIVLANAAQEMAYHFEKVYHGCSQAVMRGVLHSLGMKEEALFAAAFPFAGGLGMKQGLCGAVVGGIMCLGMASKKYGRGWNEFNQWDLEQVLTAQYAVGAFYDRCQEALGGTVSCRELTGMEIKGAEDVMKFLGTAGFETCCVTCGKVARMVVETLLDEA